MPPNIIPVKNKAYWFAEAKSIIQRLYNESDHPACLVRLNFLEKICREEKFDLKEIRIDIGAQPHQKNLTLLHLMAIRGKREIIEKLINNRIHLIKFPRNIVHPTGKTVAHFAVESAMRDVNALGEVIHSPHNLNINSILDILCDPTKKDFIDVYTPSDDSETAVPFTLSRAAASRKAKTCFDHLAELLNKQHGLDLYKENPEIFALFIEENAAEEAQDEMHLCNEAGSGEELESNANEFKKEYVHPLQKEDIRRVITKLREGNNAQTNCSILSRHLMKFFETLKFPDVPAETREATVADSEVAIERAPVRIKLESGGSVEVRQVVSSVAKIRPNSILEIPPQPKSYFRFTDNTLATRIDMTVKQVSEQRAHYTEVTDKILAAASAEGGILWGTISFYRIGISADAHEAAFYCDASTGEVWYIEAQDYNGKKKKGDPIFTNLANRNTFCKMQVEEKGNVDGETYGDYVFWLPYGSANIPVVKQEEDLEPPRIVSSSAARALVASIPFLQSLQMQRLQQAEEDCTIGVRKISLNNLRR